MRIFTEPEKPGGARDISAVITHGAGSGKSTLLRRGHTLTAGGDS
jgi:hypothetical protein